MNEFEYLKSIANVAENLAFLMPSGPAEHEHDTWLYQVQVDWTGPDGSRGRILVALDKGAAEATTANLLGIQSNEVPDMVAVMEACNELANVIAGNLLPVKYGINHEFHLHPPKPVQIAPLKGPDMVRLQLVEGVIGMCIDEDDENARKLKTIPSGECA